MGGAWSEPQPTVPTEVEESEENEIEKRNADYLDELCERRRLEREEELTSFREDLAKKRELRKETLAGISDKISRLSKESEDEREKRAQAEETVEKMKEAMGEDLDKVKLLERLKEAQEALKNQEETMEDLRQKSLKVDELEKLVDALRDVSRIGKQMQLLREKQVEDLKARLKLIQDTRTEYEVEVSKIKKLRDLYDERAQALVKEHETELEEEKEKTAVAHTKLAIQQQTINDLEEKNSELNEKLANLDKTVDETRQELSDSRIHLASKSEDLYHATSQMEAINSLLSQVLMGPEVDFDRLVRLLEDNHALISDLTTKGEINNLASVLVDVAGRADGLEENTMNSEQQDIIENLRKVWRVLVELLSHHTEGSKGTDGVPESCYKSVNTPSGPQLVISASQTFLKLKDLILEKNSLIKEVGRLKSLNGHLENRLEQQEKRLSLVTSELHNTWTVVNTLKAQHKQLHNHERILRYELKHKRHMLNELKKELERCREQWEEARAKNNQTEEDWKNLRSEFALRKKERDHYNGFTVESNEDESPVSCDISDSPEEDDEIHKSCVVKEHHISPIEDSPSEELLADVIEDFNDLPPDDSFYKSLLAQGSNQTTWTDPETPSTSQEGKSPPKKSEKEMQYEAALRDVAAAMKISSSSSNLPPPRSLSPVIEESPSTSPKEEPSSPGTSTEEPKKLSSEEMLARREERLNRLESQCQMLFTQMSSTSARSDMISNRLEELHEHYGGDNDPKPLQSTDSPQEPDPQ